MTSFDWESGWNIRRVMRQFQFVFNPQCELELSCSELFKCCCILCSNWCSVNWCKVAAQIALLEVEKEGHKLDHGKWCPDLDDNTFMYEDRDRKDEDVKSEVNYLTDWPTCN